MNAAELLGQKNLDDLLETILGWDSQDAQIGGDDRTVHPWLNCTDYRIMRLNYKDDHFWDVYN